MHIGIVTSSLGPRLGNACATTGTLSMQPLADGGTISRHNERHGPSDQPRESWPEQPLRLHREHAGRSGRHGQLPRLVPAGVGCQRRRHRRAPARRRSGIRCSSSPTSRAWSRGCTPSVAGSSRSSSRAGTSFLVQPTGPVRVSSALGGAGNNLAQWVGVDTVLLAQRADFLARPGLARRRRRAVRRERLGDRRAVVRRERLELHVDVVRPAARHERVRCHSERSLVHVVARSARISTDPQCMMSS